MRPPRKTEPGAPMPRACLLAWVLCPAAATTAWAEVRVDVEHVNPGTRVKQEEVAAEVRNAIQIAAPGGGYVLASDHSLHDGIPIGNILEMRRAGLEYGSRVCRG